MPAIKCNNGKWKWGQHGKCVFQTKAAAEAAGRAIHAQKSNKKKKK